MNKKIKLILTFSFGFILCQQVFAIEMRRCSGEFLDFKAADGRHEWTKKCFPQFRHILKSRERGGYPCFGHVAEDGDVSNPENWFAPTDKDAPCEYPEGYTITNMCV